MNHIIVKAITHRVTQMLPIFEIMNHNKNAIYNVMMMCLCECICNIHTKIQNLFCKAVLTLIIYDSILLCCFIPSYEFLNDWWKFTNLAHKYLLTCILAIGHGHSDHLQESLSMWRPFFNCYLLVRKSL